ncbi:formate--tetrahydrofolate ligase [Dehalococcoides sp. THU3]|uniref:formate--tetrahydrofolate ligase n=1 Tax=Dehalococcoides TaxID=61434 RepID=UPI003218B67F
MTINNRKSHLKDLDPGLMKDWEIAEKAEEFLKPSKLLAEELGLTEDEIIPHGKYVAKVDFAGVLTRLKDRPNGKYIDVTAITPTPLGEGKSTTTMGLVQGLGNLGKKVTGAIRQPSSGPTFNIKGSAAGGGRSQCLPLSPFTLGLTGDIDAVTNSHNLAMVALQARLQHEANNTDEFLSSRNLKRLDIDPARVELKWAIDFCAQSLREIIMGIGGKTNGYQMRSGFGISVSSEVMAILSVFTGLADLRERMSKIIVAYRQNSEPVTTADLEVDGAMTALLLRAVNPNLLQTIEGQPVFVHAGPFANIAIGQSSIVADRLALKLADYHVTESGFGADIGFEKFWNIKCRLSGLKPDCAVIVATVRALKMHGGGPKVTPGAPLDPAYTTPNAALVEKGCQNMLAHIQTVKMAGINPVVCINHFASDTPQEINIIRRTAEQAGARVAVSYHWANGGEGAAELAEAVIDACNEPNDFHFLYPEDMPLRERIETIARKVYGADGVSYSQTALEKLTRLENTGNTQFMPSCMVKTHLSLSHDPALKGRPGGFTLPIRDILTYMGAGLVVPVAGDIKLMPGTSSDPNFRRIDVDTQTGKVKGLF